MPGGAEIQEEQTALLDVAGLRKAYGERTVVGDFDLAVAPGTAVALTGPNGCGKSTVLRCLSGHLECTARRFQAEGRTARPHSAAYRRLVFPVFDDFAFFPDLTVVEHLELLAGLHELPDGAAAAAGALDRFGIGAVARQFPVTLSSGQSRRVALACAAVRPWSVLLLDEPEQRLDEDGRDRLLRFLEERLGQGKAVVLATHDRPLVEALGARAIAMGA